MSSKNGTLATRFLSLSKNGEKSTVEIKMLPPENIGEFEYKCRYIITGLSNKIENYAIGGDGFQSIILALKKIGVDLYTTDEYKSRKLTYNGETDLGIPLPDGLDDLVIR